MKSLFPLVNKCRAPAARAVSCAAIAAACASGSSSAAVLRKSLADLAEKDTVCKVWVIFTDKTGFVGAASVTRDAQRRRQRAGIGGTTWADVPVPQERIRDVERIGGRCANIFKWADAASFVVPSSRLAELARQPYVRDLVPVRTFASEKKQVPRAGLGKSRAAADLLYGCALTQLSVLNVPPAHRYIRETAGAPPGQGVLIGMFDSGFRFTHPCLKRLVSDHRVVADSDFVDHDTTVEDPDSVVDNPLNLYWHNDEHGTETLSLIAGYDSSRFTGDAYAARFVLARTEDSPVEHHVEEDNWAAAMVWAESLGVSIVSSSLGYNTGFTPPDTDYTFQDMNGNTTIISKAARQAVAFGMIIVNAMGNDDPFLVAPADVDGVVSVGAIDTNLTIASFSDRGPTADGRIKPDCVAPGVLDAVPAVYDPYGGYTAGSGTSFSTPLVAGVCALILQVDNGSSAAAVRQRLYSSCFYVPGQDTMNNTYGRGVPDALLAVLPDSQGYITVADSFGQAVAGATARTTAGAVAGTSDSSGYAIVNIAGPFPETLVVSHPSHIPAQAAIPSRHSRMRVLLADRYVLRVVLRDSTDAAAVTGTVFWRTTGAAAFVAQKTDSLGVALITAAQSPDVDFYGEGPGYFGSATVHLTMTAGVTASDTLRLGPRTASQFVIYPNVLNIATKHQRLTFEFTSSPDNPRAYSQVFSAAIRSIDGTLIWKFSKVLAEQTPLVLTWPDAGATVAPGVYYFVVMYGGKVYKKKFLVIG